MIKYPLGSVSPTIKAKTGRLVSTAANRGMSLEHDLNLSNDYYNEKNIALITKRPTPINVVRVDYSKGARITDAYFEKQSTTDYNGIYRGKYLDFEAKSTLSSSSFPLSNIFLHQYEHLQRVIDQGGLAFFIIRFTTLGASFILPAQEVINFKNTAIRQSIPLAFIQEKGFQINEGFTPRLDYLKAVDELFFNR
ncbi:MAG TPA: Holliday junction resolvase RecU [Firmicutes bacterium]|jgi:recombination protein U|nr:Holliday junction resolvase RecU [Bacillota bacterium]